MQTPGLIALDSSHDGAGTTLDQRKCALRAARYIEEEGRQVLLPCDGFWCGRSWTGSACERVPNVSGGRRDEPRIFLSTTGATATRSPPARSYAGEARAQRGPWRYAWRFSYVGGDHYA